MLFCCNTSKIICDNHICNADFISPVFYSMCEIDDLKLCDGPDSKVLARKELLVDTLWGPFSGSIQSDETANGVSNQVIKKSIGS